MKKRILAFLLAICLVFGQSPVFVGAAEEQKVTAGTATVTAGNTAYVSLWAENFANIATLEVYVYYDPSVFAVSNTYNGNMLYESQVSVNTAQAGTVKMVAMSLDGISGSGELLNLYFSTESGAAAGTYPIKVAIGNAYDTALLPVTVGSANGSITVLEREETESFYVYSYTNNYYAQQGDEIYCYINSEWSRGFVSGDFTFTYDHELFAYEDIVLSSELTGEGAIWSVNSSVLGQVRIAYASDKPINSYQLFTVKLKVIADSAAYTSLKIQAANVYREDLSMYLPYNSETWVQLQKLPEVTDDPNVWLETSRMIVGQPATSIFCLEKGAGIAAADFTVTYDPTVLRCTGVKVCDTVAGQKGMVIISDKISDGKVRFSYINMDAYDEADISLVEIAWEPLQSPAAHYQLSISGVGVVDAQQKAMPLEYLTDSSCIFLRSVVPPTCLDDGYTDHVCACGKNYQTDPTTKLGHDIQNFPAQAVSCTEPGWDAYVGCSRCDYGTKVEIPALGHDEIFHEAKAVSCTQIGWDDYVTCGRCDHSTYEEIPALGHRVIVPTQIPADPFSVKNHAMYPFELIDGIYYSTNHNANSMSRIVFTAEYDCSVTVYYGVSSENNCDIIRFRRNNSVLFNNSGEATGSIALLLSAGETIALDYQKDGSVDTGSDQGWIRLEYEYVLVDGYADAPAETVESDCVNGVVCSYCKTVVKEPLGHNEIPHEGKAPACEQEGFAPYVTCSRCDYTTYQSIPALGHDEIFHEGKEAACMEPGWEDYTTCSRCDYSDFVELPALGHRVMEIRPSLVDPLEVQNDGAVPFEEIDGVFYSQNHTDNSSSEFTVTALYDCTVTVIYSVSSETNYDKLWLLRNGDQMDVISGTVKNKRGRSVLSAGDVLTIRYSKDSSAANGEDRGWVRFEYDYVTQDLPALVPAEDKMPTCTEAVVCAVCNAVAKETLPHREIFHEGQVATCMESGWEPYVTCEDCNYTTFQVIPALEHDLYLEGPLNPTCTNGGYEVSGYCRRCNYVVYVGIPALGHDYVEHTGQTATCLEVGWYPYTTCSRCDYTTYQEIPALGHDEITHGSKQVTCTQIGWEEYVICSRCDYSTYHEIPALEHSWTVQIPSAATLRTEGKNCTECNTYWYHCEKCQSISDTHFFESDLFGPHSFTEQIKDDAHRVPGSQDPAYYYYDCAHCDMIGEQIFSDVLKGDMEGDGDVDEDDAIYLLQHVLMPDFFPANQPCDVEGDGDVDEDDAIYLLQHVLMPEFFPL